MGLKVRSIQNIWHAATIPQKVVLVIGCLGLAWLTYGLAAIGGIAWYLLSMANSNVGFMLASQAIPALINRFNQKPHLHEGTFTSKVPRRVEISDSARHAVLDHAIAYLNGLVGLAPIKEQIRKYQAVMKVERRRRVLNGSAGQQPMANLNLVFSGSPGTGKTSVARVWGDILYGVGMLDSGHLVETDRSSLVGKYVGHTAQLTLDACEAALDGVLFIDEAYTLSRPSVEADYGHEAIETIMKYMEDHKGRISVVVAGYPNEMDAFLDNDPGLKSRFPRKMLFNDYTPEELERIFEDCSSSDGMVIPESGKDFLVAFFKSVAAAKLDFGNARFVRNFYETCKENHALRLADAPSFSDTELNSFDLADYKRSIEVHH